MVDIVDDTRTFTVAVAEGLGAIENLSYPSEVAPGDPIPISFNLRNAGGTDTLFAKITALGVTEDMFRGVVDTGASVPVSFQILVMPPYTLEATLEVGHEE